MSGDGEREAGSDASGVRMDESASVFRHKNSRAWHEQHRRCCNSTAFASAMTRRSRRFVRVLVGLMVGRRLQLKQFSGRLCAARLPA